MAGFTQFLLHPALIWFLPLAAVPILLHLLTLHRLKTVELSTYRFLFDSYVQQRRRMQFLEALLAMLRALFILLLVAAFCRPMIKNWGSLFRTGSGREVVMLVDCSASMNVASAGVPALERAKTAAKHVVEQLSPDDRLTLVRVVSRPEEIFSRFSSDTENIQGKIEELKTSPARANVFAALSYVFGPESPPRKNPIIYVFTDCQASGWNEVKQQGLDKIVPAATEFIVVNVGSNETVSNLAVIGDAPRRHRAVVGLPIHLRSRVANFSTTENAEVTLTTIIDEKEISRTRMKLEPGEKATHTVIYEPNEKGVHRGRFEITGKNADRFPEDDNFRFTLNVEDKLKVLLVNGNPAPADPFDSEILFLKSALTIDPDNVKDEKKSALVKDKAFLRSLETVEVAEGSLTAEVLKDISVVVLANCGALGQPQFTLLQNFVAEGGGLIVFPGDRLANPALYNDYFFTVPGTVKRELTDVRFGPPVGDPQKPETFERLGVIDYAHPAMSVFEDPNSRYFTTVSFKEHFSLKLPEQRNNSWSLAEFSNGGPALVESKYGDGLVVVAAFPANSRWTNLPLRLEFVPLLLRLVGHVQHRPEVEGPSVVPADGVAEFKVTGAWAPVGGSVTDSAGRPHQLPFERSATRQVSAFDKTAERGYYAVEIKGGRPDQHKELSFAVNLAREESDFTTLNHEQFRNLLPGGHLTFVDASAEVQQNLGSIGEAPSEVWQYLIYLVFFIIGVEFMLATFGGAHKGPEENLTVAERIKAISPGSWVGKMTGAQTQGTD